MRFVITVSVLLFAATGLGTKLEKRNPLGWPRSNAAEFGCFLQRQFGYRDGRFYCGIKHFMNKSDPCGGSEAYEAGPVFPRSHVKKVDPAIESIQLSWEHGDLQAVTITLSRSLNDGEVRTKFGLPAERNRFPSNINDISIQKCAADKTCLVLQGFDHQGAGDLDCPPS